MTYLLQFADKSTKRIPDAVGAQVVQSLAKQQGVTINGAYYAHHMISACRPLRVWVEEQQETARKQGHYFCRYGYHHESRGDCGCKDAGFVPLPDVTDLFPKLAPPREEDPQTPEEAEKATAYAQIRRQLVESKSMKPALPEPIQAKADCPNCDGTGNWLFEGTLITCSCITGR